MFKQAVMAVIAASVLGVSTTSDAIPHRGHLCNWHVSELTVNGEPLTYQRAAQLRGAKLGARGVVHTPPVKLPSGRPAVFAIERDGCAQPILDREPLAPFDARRTVAR